MAQTSKPTIDPDLAAQLQQILDDELSAQGLKGLSAAVIIPGSEVWRGVSGLSGPGYYDVMRPDMLFGIASIKKTFVAALVLQLTEEGVLSLEDPLGQWLPNYPYINQEITLRHLLSHTCGIYNYTEHPTFWNTLATGAVKIWTPEELLGTFVSTPPFAAGSRFEYCNTNFLLSSMVIKAATGSSISDHYRDRFGHLLKLEGTFVGAEEAIEGEIALNWTDRDGDGRLENISDIVGPSMYTMLWPFLLSTAEDIAKWASALYGGQLLSAASLDKMLDFRPINTVVWTGYGLGAMRMVLRGEELWGHTGLIPGYRSMMAYWPSTGISISVLGNQDEYSVYMVVSRMLKALKESPAVSTTMAPNSPGPHEIILHPGYPNPFHQNMSIAFDLPRTETVTLEIFDAQGRKVETLINGPLGPGSHEVQWQPNETTSGVYLYRLQAGGNSASRTALLIK